MKTLLVLLLVMLSTSANAMEEKDARAIKDLAAKIFLEISLNHKFDWSNVSCEELMKEALEVAAEEHYKDKKERQDKKDKPKEIEL